MLAVSIPFLGNYMAKVFEGERTIGDRVFRPIERFIYRVCGVDPEREQRWNIYALSLLAFSVVGSILFVYAVQRLQGRLPFNPTTWSGASRPSRSTPRSAS